MGLVHDMLTLGPFATNAYLIRCEETGEAVVVDVGFEPERMLELVRRTGVRVRHLVNTHAHYDHVAAMRAMQEAIGGDYWLHPEDRFLLHGLSAQGAAFGLPPVRIPDTIHDLQDGGRLEVGRESLEILHTPGHSPGSVTLRWADDLWVGDLLFAGSIGRTDFPGGSFETLRHSVRMRLFPLGDHLRVFPGHGPETTLGEERRSNPFVGDMASLA